MEYRFPVHNLNHTTLLVDITSIGIPSEVYPPEGKPQTVSSLRFPSWAPAEKYLTEHGANKVALRGLQEVLQKNGVGVLTIT
jgi:hypothetical protein